MNTLHSRGFRALTWGISPLLAGGLAALLVWLSAPAFADGERYIAESRKIHCSTVDAKPVVYFWAGNMYSRVTGERDRLLFKVHGMNVRQCSEVRDEKRGLGYKLVSRELMLYMDPKSGEILREWENPWTGQTVQVLHVANDPVNHSNYVIGRDGKPSQLGIAKHGKRFSLPIVIPLFYPNPLGGEYQKYVGGTYQASELFTFFGALSDLRGKRDTIPIEVAWTRLGQWLPWMEMNGREGMMYVNASGHKLRNWKQLPAQMRREIRRNYPSYVKPPPVDDARRNETSWSVFKKEIDRQRSQDSGK